MKKYFYILFISITLASCSQFQKALKSDDTKLKYEVAEKLYESGKYAKAIRLFEQLAPSFRGRPQAEKLFYMQAQSYYKLKQYGASGYNFEKFAAQYFNSEKREEALFLSAKSYYHLSPVYSKEQIDTYKAIDKIQLFIDAYPNSEYLDEANLIAKELREKLEKKAFEIAKLYNSTSYYKSAIKAFDNFINDYPGTPFKEDALFYKYDSSYQLAINSVYDKMEERLNSAKANYNALIKFKSDTKHKQKADEMLVKIEKELQQFSK